MAEHAWQLLNRPRDPGGDDYYEHVRTELVDLLTAPPRRFVEVGCGTGLTGAEVKRRYPAAIVDGFEQNPAAAALACGRLDTVHGGDAGALDLGALYAPGSVDALLLADVLEHLYNPWDFLTRFRPLLAPGAQVIASIPNLRNWLLLNQLAGGTFAYRESGLLDVTHVRFFTRIEILKMFDQTGYDVLSIEGKRDPNIPEITPPEFPIDIESDHLVFRGVTPEVLSELSTIQFYVRASPRSGVHSGPTATGGGNAT